MFILVGMGSDGSSRALVPVGSGGPGGSDNAGKGDRHTRF